MGINILGYCGTRSRRNVHYELTVTRCPNLRPPILKLRDVIEVIEGLKIPCINLNDDFQATQIPHLPLSCSPPLQVLQQLPLLSKSISHPLLPTKRMPVMWAALKQFLLLGHGQILLWQSDSLGQRISFRARESDCVHRLCRPQCLSDPRSTA